MLCFWIGVYPKPFLEFLHEPAARVAAIVQPAKFGPAHGARGVAGRDPAPAPPSRAGPRAAGDPDGPPGSS